MLTKEIKPKAATSMRNHTFMRSGGIASDIIRAMRIKKMYKYANIKLKVPFSNSSSKNSFPSTVTANSSVKKA